VKHLRPLFLSFMILGGASCLGEPAPASAQLPPTLTAHLEGDFVNPKCHYKYSAAPDGTFEFEISYPDDESRVWFESTVSGKGTLYPAAIRSMLQSTREFAFFDLPEHIKSGSRAALSDHHAIRISNGSLTREVQIDGVDSKDPAAFRFWRLWMDLMQAFPASPRQIPMGSGAAVQSSNNSSDRSSNS